MNQQKNKNIGIIIYANPDYYPPLFSLINIISKEYRIILISRNQGGAQLDYPENVNVYRLGRQQSFREKEKQNCLLKFLEYATFLLRAILYLRANKCRLVYAIDMHGFVAGFIVARFGKKIPLLYHNFDLHELIYLSGISRIVKYLELRLARDADKIIFCDTNRAKFFQKQAKLSEIPDTVINAPLLVNKLPENKLRDILISKGFTSEARVVLYQGLLNNGRCILEALESMVYWPKDTVFVLIGYAAEDFMSIFWRKAEELKLSSRIIQLPFVEHRQIFSYTQGAYLGVAFYEPTHYNQIYIVGASNKIFEYLSLGVPVLTNDSPYFRQVLDRSLAYFAKQDSVEDIAGAINLAFSDQSQYRKKSQAARKMHLDKFNYQTQFKPALEFIRKTVI